jgi:type II secretory pathway predicted ATPase ExeA
MSSQDSNKFDERIFPASPCVERYFPGSSIEEGRERLVRSISHGAGPGLIIGATGTGKSMLLQVLAAQFSELLDIAILSSAQLCTRRALLQAILFELGLPHRYVDEGRLRITLAQHLLQCERSPNGTLLLVDEAQSLPIHLLEEIRQLTNIVRNGQPRVRLVIAGSPALEETLADPQLESFQQRVATRCYLVPLGIAETGQYIRAHFEMAGIDAASCIDSEVQQAVYNATDGICRLVSQLCDHALLLASEKGLDQLSVSLIQEAWADLQQLPVPAETEPAVLANCPAQNVVEFGELTTPGDDFGMSDDSLPDHLPQGTPLTVETLALETDDLDQDETTDMSGDENSCTSPFDGQTLPDWQSGSCDATDGEQFSTPALLKPAAEVDSLELLPEAFPIETSGQVTTVQEGSNSDVEVGNFTPAQEATDDPFAEEFVEEEIVLEEFSALGDAFSDQTPRVVSCGDDLSNLVREVGGIDGERGTSQTMSSHKPDDHLHFPTPVSLPHSTVNDELSANDELPLPIATTIEPGLDLPNNALLGNDTDVEEVADLHASVTLKYPVADPSHFVQQPDGLSDASKAHTGQRQLAGNAEHAVDPEMIDNILIVEDDPADSGQIESSVRRQEYGQLFTRLRSG